MDLQEAERKGAKLSDMAVDGDKWRAPENMVAKFYISPFVNW